MTAAEKLESDELLNLAPASFAEYITVYKRPLVTSTQTDAFNFTFGGQGSESTFTPQSGRFLGTVEYIDQHDNQQIRYSPSDSPAQQLQGYVRLSLSGAEARSFLRDAQVIQFDNMNFVIESDLLYRGLFNRDVWTDCWLSKSDDATI